MQEYLLGTGLVREGFLCKVELRSGGQVSYHEQRKESEFCINNMSNIWMNKEQEEEKMGKS